MIEVGQAGASGMALGLWSRPAGAWKAVLLRAWHEQSEDNIGLIAAGVAFYAFLALVPLLGAVVLSYGLVATPQTVVANVRHLAEVMPGSTAQLVRAQLMHVVTASDGKKGLGLALALALALFGARSGAGAVITALNIAYEEKETRGVVALTLLALGATIAAVLFAIVAMSAVAALGHLAALMPGSSLVLIVAGKILTYVLLTVGGAGIAATLYRFGPARHDAVWRWITPGSVLATGGWLVLTLGFGVYVAHFGNYDATYGSLGAVVVLLTWLYLSSYVFLFGAELNSEIEKASTSIRPASPEPAAATLPAAAAIAPAAPPAPARTDGAALLAAALGARLAPLVGGGRTGWAPALAAGLGLGLARRRAHAEGLALIAVAAGLAWISGRRDPDPRIVRICG